MHIVFLSSALPCVSFQNDIALIHLSFSLFLSLSLSLSLFLFLFLSLSLSLSLSFSLSFSLFLSLFLSLLLAHMFRFNFHPIMTSLRINDASFSISYHPPPSSPLSSLE